MILYALFIGFLLTGVVGASGAYGDVSPDKSLPTFVQSKQPPRVGFLSLNRDLDRVKPLAMLDSSGWMYNSGMLVGSVDSRWVVGLSWTLRKDEWWLDGGTTMTAPPGSFGSHVVLGFKDGMIRKVDALTGKVAWETRLDSFTERGFVLLGSKLYVLTAAQILHALDFQTGKILWVFDGGFPDGLVIRGRAKPVHHDGKLYFGLSSGEVVCVNSETGQMEWRQNPDFIEGQFHDFVSDMVVRDGLLLFARYDGLVGALDLKSPSKNTVWKQELPGLTVMAVRGSRLYLGGVNGDIRAKNIADLGAAKSFESFDKDLWRVATGTSVSTFTLTEELLIASGLEGRITAVATGTGETVWHDDLQSPVATTPLLIGQTLYFSTGLKGLYGYQISPSDPAATPSIPQF